MHRFGHFVVALLLVLPSVAHAALININTADREALEALPHIGQATADKIIAYRTQHGPFTTITDLQKVSGIGSGKNYEDIAPLITVGEGAEVASTPVPTAASTTPAGGSATPYIPPPSSLAIHIEGEQRAVLEVPLRLRAQATTKGGTTDPSAELLWSFGDGSSATGSEVEKVYRYAGEYLVVAQALDGPARARDELMIVAVPARISIPSVTGDGITIRNDTDGEVDLSGWRLLALGSTFRIPDGMILLAGRSVLFPRSVINLPMGEATLTYPSGVIAAVYRPTPVQPLADDVRYKEVQAGQDDVTSAVKEAGASITSDTGIISAHEEPVIAPEASPNAGGASGALSGQAAVGATRIPHFLQSPWTVGLLGVLVVASGAFILL
jgi:competence ComEA-like helix-hairpin-helix protein